MSDYAIRVEGLGKRYRLGLQDNAAGGIYRYKSLRDNLGGLTEPVARPRSDRFLARESARSARPTMWLVGGIATVANFLLGLTYFRRVEKMFADIV